MVYKFVSEYEIKKETNPIKVNGISYSNPTAETLKNLGYLPLEEVERPEDKEGFYLVRKYTKKSNKISMNWEYVPATEEE